jgi:hypothetical protein
MQQINLLIWLHLATVIPLLTFKIVVLVIGYFIAKLGHNLLVQGVSGKFKFSTGFKGMKADLISASPGLFFILMAFLMISLAIIKDTPFSTKYTESLNKEVNNVHQKMESQSKPPKPYFPKTLQGKDGQ